MAKGAFFRTERNYRVKTADIFRLYLTGETRRIAISLH